MTKNTFKIKDSTGNFFKTYTREGNKIDRVFETFADARAFLLFDKVMGFAQCFENESTFFMMGPKSVLERHPELKKVSVIEIEE